jgi:hypothetical protein
VPTQAAARASLADSRVRELTEDERVPLLSVAPIVCVETTRYLDVLMAEDARNSGFVCARGDDQEGREGAPEVVREGRGRVSPNRASEASDPCA